MTIQYSTTHRNNNMADIITQAGATAYMLIYDNSGGVPINPAAAATGVVLVSIALANPIAAAPVSGVLTASAVTSVPASAAGTAAYFRVCTSAAGTTCVMQGTVGATGSGADMTLPSTTIALGQAIGIGTFTDTANGA